MRIGIAILATAIGGGAALGAEITASSQVAGVTVFPQGAEVSRLVKVPVAAGEHVIIVPDLPADAVAGSIRVEGRATGRLEIGAVDIRRLFVPETDPANTASARKALEDELERARDGKAALDGELEAIEAQRTYVSNLAGLPARPPAAGAGGNEEWGEVLTLIQSSMGEIQRQALATRIKIRTAERAIRDIEKRLAELAPRQRQRTEVKVSVRAAAAVEADLTLRYQVQQASWRPLYDARLATGSRTQAPALTLTRRASIQQRTGEPWEQVAIRLSTVRPASRSSAPELPPVTIDFEPERPPVPVAAAPRAPAPDGRQLARSRDAAESRPGGVASPLAAKVVADETDAVQIDAGAFQAVFEVPGALTVPNNGEVKAVRIDERRFEPALSVRAVPRVEQRAFLYAKLALPKGVPHLAGQVSLFRDQTFVGTGQLPQLAGGSEHELGFGADDAVRVEFAVVEEKRGESGLISSSRTDHRNFRIAIKSLHERPIAFSVIDQVPVSLNQDIKVELTARTPPTRKDIDQKRGIMAWDDKLAPDEERVIEFGYKVIWPAGKSIVWQ